MFQVVREERECDVREGEKSGRKSFEESVWLSNSGARAQMRRKRRGRRLARRASGERERRTHEGKRRADQEEREACDGGMPVPWIWTEDSLAHTLTSEG